MSSPSLISRKTAAQAALRIIDKHGIKGLSMQLVAGHLGVRAPSLYHHFKNKEEMLAEVAKLLLEGALKDKKSKHKNWREEQIAIAVAARRSLLKHPEAAPLVLEFFSRHILLQDYDEWLAKRKELSPEQRMMVIEGLEKLTFGSALFGAKEKASGKGLTPTFPADKFPNLDETLRGTSLGEEEVFINILRRFLSTF